MRLLRDREPLFADFFCKFVNHCVYFKSLAGTTGQNWWWIAVLGLRNHHSPSWPPCVTQPLASCQFARNHPLEVIVHFSQGFSNPADLLGVRVYSQIAY